MKTIITQTSLRRVFFCLGLLAAQKLCQDESTIKIPTKDFSRLVDVLPRARSEWWDSLRIKAFALLLEFITISFV